MRLVRLDHMATATLDLRVDHSPSGAPVATFDCNGICRIRAINSGSNCLAVSSPASCAYLK